MPRPQKFNFTPVTRRSQLSRGSQSFVSINNKGSIIFNRACIEQYSLADRHIQFFVDIEKKTIGWRIIETIHDFKDVKNKKYRLIRPSAWHTATLSIRFIMKEMGLHGTAFHKLKIDKYIDTIYNTIYYITLKHESIERD